MFLTAEQLHGLTGRKRPKAQIAWLTRHGYRFEVDANERPVVLASHVERRFGGTRDEPTWELDLDRLAR